ncbi:MAG: DUF3106 domain-containing protein [Burkholderiaceae bacterium]|nr:DUF3106 domain-containing protein [Burkholderiaceae bacterium]MDO9090434.1 DUF3106 domain-containing protein [Burkholderiaceae bacterium]
MEKLSVFVLLAISASFSWAVAQPSAPAAPGQGNATLLAQSRPAPRPAAKSSGWAELTPAQQQALRPLAANWGSISEAQKRKWIALSQNYPKLPAAEQTKLHSRMTEWVALSPQQRSQARLNFAETKKLTPDDKKAQWKAYQALSPEERRKLAKSAAKPGGAAPAVKPVAPQKLAAVPTPVRKPSRPLPTIAAGPNQVDQNTLLPQAAPPAAPGRTQ